jgi:hypothetical protein
MWFAFTRWMAVQDAWAAHALRWLGGPEPRQKEKR